MIAAVGGSSTLYGAQWMRLLPSDFKVKTMDGICDDWPIDSMSSSLSTIGSTVSSA